MPLFFVYFIIHIIFLQQSHHLLSFLYSVYHDIYFFIRILTSRISLNVGYERDFIFFWYLALVYLMLFISEPAIFRYKVEPTDRQLRSSIFSSSQMQIIFEIP